MDIDTISNSGIVILSKDDLKNIKGASYGVESLNNSGGDYCLATFCTTVNDCDDVYCRVCEALDQDGGVCMP